jgi:hypothetical protein
VAAGGVGVNGPPVRASRWTAPDGLSISDRIALDDLADRLSGFYDVGYTEGGYWAFRLIGGPLLAADTLGGIDSAVRADWSRWKQHAAGRAR